VDQPSASGRLTPAIVHDAFDVPDWRPSGPNLNRPDLKVAPVAPGFAEFRHLGRPLERFRNRERVGRTATEVEPLLQVDQTLGIREFVLPTQNRVEAAVGQSCGSQGEKKCQDERRSGVALPEKADLDRHRCAIDEACLADEPLFGPGWHPPQRYDDLSCRLPLLIC
jgi:hypothetical protein